MSNPLNQEPIPSGYDLSSKEWRMNHLYKVIDKKGQLVIFKMKPYQKLLFDALQKHPRQVIPKGRQLGITTFFAIYMTDEVLFTPNYKAVMIAHEHDVMKTIFEKVKIAWEEFPTNLKKFIGWEVTTDNKRALEFNNHSSFTVALTSRGGSVNHLHISELGKIAKEYPDKLDEILTGAIPSVTPDGKVTIESTVEEPQGVFRDFWDQATDEVTPQTPRKDFQRMFLPWMLDEAYTEDPTYIYKELPQRLLDLQLRYRLTDGQVCWYFLTQRSGKLTDQKMSQQYPFTPEDAWSSSVDNFFDVNGIRKRLLLDVTPPIETINGWEIFEKYNKKHRYAIGADPSEGIKRDYSAAILIDFSYRLDNYQIVPKVVARFKSNTVDPLDFAHVLADMGNMYGTCMIGPERNNMGIATIGKLQEIYGNIYKQRIKDRVEEKETDRYGFLTTASTKPELMSQLKAAINDFGLLVPDSHILKECELYGMNDFKRIKGDDNVTSHFDLIMAMAIAWELRNYAIESYGSEPEYVTMPMDSNSRMIQI